MSPAVVAALAIVTGALAVRSAVAGVTPLRAGLRARARVADQVRGASVRTIVVPLWMALAARRVVVVVTELTGGASRARRRADRALPALLDVVTRQLRSGASLPVAVRVAAAAGSDLGTRHLAEELEAGAPLAAAVADWRACCPTPARGLVAAALSMASDSGGSVASVLDGVTDTLRDRIAVEREVAALSSQARASAAVLVIAPLVFAVLAAAADPRVAQVLFGGPSGWACLAGGVVLDAVGALWMARLVGRSR